MSLRLEEGGLGFMYLVVNEETGEDILVQTDWDYPGTASTFGWVPKKTPMKGPGTKGAKWCDHDSTDGTIDCPVCGRTAHDFINEAMEYLDAHIGDTVGDDPGYFGDNDPPGEPRGVGA